MGRGLADLIPVGGNVRDSFGGGAKPGANNSQIGGGSGGINTTQLGPGQETPIASLHPNPRQPRTHFDETALNELTESVRANGILQPILVRPRPTGGYEIVAGERRYRAALKAGLKAVPVVVRQLSDEETLALALIENLIRQDISALETARAFSRLMDDFGWTQEEMGKRVGKSRPAVANSLRLLHLPQMMQQSLEKGEITEGHARALCGEDKERDEKGFRDYQTRVWRAITSKHLSVRETERLMKARKTGGELHDETASAAQPTQNEPNFRALEDRLRGALGTRVRLSGSETRGKIEIEFFSPDELDGLLNRFEGPNKK